jgi:hypothetical protein
VKQKIGECNNVSNLLDFAVTVEEAWSDFAFWADSGQGCDPSLLQASFRFSQVPGRLYQLDHHRRARNVNVISIL